jgi:hypothetical protein
MIFSPESRGAAKQKRRGSSATGWHCASRAASPADSAGSIRRFTTKEFALRKTLLLLLCICALLMPAGAAIAASETPVASKDGMTFSVEDLGAYWLRNLGKEGLLDFFQMMIVYQEGLKEGLAPTEAERKEFIDKTMGPDIFQQFKQLFSEKTVNQLVEYTIVTAKYETWLRDKIAREQNITVTEEDARSYFFGNIDQFQLPEGVYLSIISVDNRPQAEAVIGRLKKGENFNDIAGEVNMDSEMRAARGEIGPYRKGDGLPQPIEDAAFQLLPNQYSDIIKGQNYHIVFVQQKLPEVSPGFDDVKEELQIDMRESRIDPFYIEAINKLMERELPRFNIQAELFKPED